VLDTVVSISGAMRAGTISLPDGRQREFSITAVASGWESLGSNIVGWPSPVIVGVKGLKITTSPTPTPSPSPTP
jgi:hypothetical protein